MAEKSREWEDMSAGNNMKLDSKEDTMGIGFELSIQGFARILGPTIFTLADLSALKHIVGLFAGRGDYIVVAQKPFHPKVRILKMPRAIPSPDDTILLHAVNLGGLTTCAIRSYPSAKMCDILRQIARAEYLGGADFDEDTTMVFVWDATRPRIDPSIEMTLSEYIGACHIVTPPRRVRDLPCDPPSLPKRRRR